MNSEALVYADKVFKNFELPSGQNVEVLRGVSFEVFPGESIAVLGRSGTGKSTLLHVLGTLESPTKGNVYFLGQDIFTFSETRLSGFRNREIGFVFQFHYLMLEFSALENVMMPGLLSGQSKKEARETAHHLLDRVGLMQRLHHRPGELSGGEQQRVAIARALFMKPKLLLTDEMTGNLDPGTGSEVFELVKELQEEMRMAIVSVTHDEALAQKYQRIVRLQDGVLWNEPRLPPL